MTLWKSKKVWHFCLLVISVFHANAKTSQKKNWLAVLNATNLFECKLNYKIIWMQIMFGILCQYCWHAVLKCICRADDGEENKFFLNVQHSYFEAEVLQTLANTGSQGADCLLCSFNSNRDWTLSLYTCAGMERGGWVCDMLEYCVMHPHTPYSLLSLKSHRHISVPWWCWTGWLHSSVVYQHPLFRNFNAMQTLLFR